MSSSADEIARQILALAVKQSELEDSVDKYAVEVRDYWRSISPVDKGDYAASIKVVKRKPVNGFPVRRIEATDFKAHWIEYGTGVDEGGKRFVPSLGVTVDGNTETPAFAPRAKTAAKFGGDESPIKE
jgi:hypothetical protein